MKSISHRSSDCLLRKVIHLAEREEEDENEVFYERDGYGEENEIMRMMMRGRTTW